MFNAINPLRLLLVAASYFPYSGGLETHVHEVGRRFARAGVEVTILTTDISRRLPSVERCEGMLIRRVPAWPGNRDYYFAPAIYAAITHGQWDIIHCQGYHNLVPPLAMLAARRTQTPFILSFHSGGDVTHLRKALRRLHWQMLRPLVKHARKLVAVSQFEADFFREHLRLPAGQFVVIPNGAQLPEARGPLRIRTGQGEREPLIVSVGRLERYKGHQRLIAAMPEVLKEIPDARLRIAGTGPYRPTLQKMAAQLGVAERVEIEPVPPAERGSMASLIVRASLVALLSEHESQGIAILEALALRRPVLVTRTAALREFADRRLARAIPLDSTPREVAEAIIGQLRQPLIPASVEFPTWNDCASRLLDLYYSIVEGVPALCAS